MISATRISSSKGTVAIQSFQALPSPFTRTEISAGTPHSKYKKSCPGSIRLSDSTFDTIPAFEYAVWTRSICNYGDI